MGVVTSGISRRFVSIPPHPAPLPRGEREFPDENYPVVGWFIYFNLSVARGDQEANHLEDTEARKERHFNSLAVNKFLWLLWLYFDSNRYPERRDGKK